MAQISPKLFSTDLAKQLFPDNVFYTKAFKDAAAGNVDSVDIPVAGNIGGAKIGNPSLPVAIGERTDDVFNYPLVQIYSEPVLVKREEEIVLNYSKQLDVARSMGGAMSTKAADYAAQAWGSTTNIITSTGANRATSLVGATGNRKRFTKADIMKVRQAFMKMNLPSINGIIGVVTPDQYDDLLQVPEFVDFEKTGLMTKLQEGVLGRILGIDIMVRWNDGIGSLGLTYDKDLNKKALGATVATDDLAAALFFHPDHVRYAEAFPETIINRKAPGYLGGTIIEAVVRFGATQSRKDGKGCVSLVEGA